MTIKIGVKDDIRKTLKTLHPVRFTRTDLHSHLDQYTLKQLSNALTQLANGGEIYRTDQSEKRERVWSTYIPEGGVVPPRGYKTKQVSHKNGNLLNEISVIQTKAKTLDKIKNRLVTLKDHVGRLIEEIERI